MWEFPRPDRWSNRRGEYGKVVDRVKIEICDNYKGFPGVEPEIGMGQVTPFQTTAQLHTSLSRKTYIYKQDLFLKINRVVRDSCKHADVVWPLLVYYLRSESYALKSRCELVEYDEEEFLNLESQVMSAMFPTRAQRFPSRTLVSVWNEMKGLFPKNHRDPGYIALYGFLEMLNKQHPIGKNSTFYNNMLNRFSKVKRVIFKFIKGRPHWFKPEKQGTLTGKPVVRLFQDCSYAKVVFAWELLEEMEKHGLSLECSVRKEIRAKEKLDVYLFNELFPLLEKQMKCIEFVQVPMQRIWSSENSCIKFVPQIGKVLMNIVSAEIRDFQIFNGVNQHKSAEIVEALEKVIGFFDFFMIGPTLLLEDKFDRMLPFVLGRLEKYHNTKKYGAPQNIGPQGFTVKDIRSEIKRCGLHRAFRNVMRYACPAVTALDETNTKRTSERLREAMVSLQAFWVIVESRIFQQFLHRTNYCGFMGENCPGCLRETAIDFEEVRDAMISYNTTLMNKQSPAKPMNAAKLEGAKNMLAKLDLLAKGLQTRSAAFEAIDLTSNLNDIPEPDLFQEYMDYVHLEETKLGLNPNEKKAKKKTKNKKRQAERKKQEKLEMACDEVEKDHNVETFDKCAKNCKLHNRGLPKLEPSEKNINMLTKKLDTLKLDRDQTRLKLKKTLYTRDLKVCNRNVIQGKNNEIRIMSSDSGVNVSVTHLEHSKKLNLAKKPMDSDSKVSPQMKQKLCELTDHLEHIRKVDPVGMATRMAEVLVEGETWEMDALDKAYDKLEEFEDMVDEYQKEVEKRIEWIRSHPDACVDEVPALPEQPVFRAYYPL